MDEAKDLTRLRGLAGRYAEIAMSDRMRELEKRARAINGLNAVKPLINIFEVPWGELNDEPELRLQCTGERARRMEYRLLMALYQHAHFMADYTLAPYFSAQVSIKGMGFGLSISEDIIDAGSGSSIRSHSYHDQIPDIESLQKIKMPTLSVDEEETAASLAFAREVFDGLMPVRRGGTSLYAAMWDLIPMFHGAQRVIDDLVDDPDYCHAAVDAFTRYFERLHSEYERLNVLEPELYYIHSTPALTDDLPQPGFDGTHVRLKDVWSRGMAQIFSVVSPAMHDEFDLQYMQRLFDPCGLSYYGCCEPLDNKIGLLRKRFKNLRKISITTWADVDRAAEEIGVDYVFSYKTNPAFVSDYCHAEAAADEVRRVIEACRRNNTPCELTLKDISTISGNVGSLTEWVRAIDAVVNEFY